MSVEIIIPPSLQPLTDPSTVITIGGGTVGECLEELARQYPKLRSRLFDENGELLKGLNIFINTEDAYPGALTRPVHDGDKIYIFFIVMGG
jgi:molybdopterin synthase sulfur carrier subunit